MSAEATTSAQLPAPRTFAPSRDDVLSNLSFFFGGEKKNTHMPKHPDNPQTHAFLLYLRICGVFLSCTRRWNGTSERQIKLSI